MNRLRAISTLMLRSKIEALTHKIAQLQERRRELRSTIAQVKHGMATGEKS